MPKQNQNRPKGGFFVKSFHALNTAHGFCGRIEVYCLSSISPILENRGIQQ